MATLPQMATLAQMAWTAPRRCKRPRRSPAQQTQSGPQNMNVEPSTLERQLQSCLDAGHGRPWQSGLELQAPWLAGAQPPGVALRALFDVQDGRIRLLLTDRIAEADALLDDGAGTSGPERLERIAAALDSTLLDPDAPCALRRRAVAKPWGQELWYTGIETRAVCAVAAPPAADRTDGRRRTKARDGEIPLPWLLAALPSRFGGIDAPVLLKILDPHAEPVRGDLYFELHERKQEVYVVTGIDPRAWPDGRGAARMGFDIERIRALGDAGLRRAFSAAVAAYRPLRNRIDALLDVQRETEGIAADAVVDPDRARRWEQRLPADLLALERLLRADIEALTALEPLRVGDVVEVPRRVPHALQHGVRVVEFQTPAYERQILYFGQKVLTQGHWDTEQALARMLLRPPAARPAVVEHAIDGARAERIVDFEDFHVLRIRLAPGACCPLPSAGHAVLMGIEGRVLIGNADAGPEEALLIPGAVLRQGVRADDGPATCLVALPGRGAHPEHEA